MNPLYLAARKIAQWRNDPIQFVRDQFDIEPDEWQKDFLRAYANNHQIAAKACKGPGKTAVLAWCCWHFLSCHSHPKIAATSISGDNLRDGLWTEMAKWQQKSEFLKAAFTWRAERITCNDSPETWFMSARRWARDATGDQQANSLAGLHADNIMFVLDEAGGIPDAVMAAAEAIMANAGSDVNPKAIAKILLCGNPTHLSGPLYRACTSEATKWHVIEITGDPDNPKRSPRISKEWARDQIAKYGADNPWVLVNVFGRFPPSSINALLGPDDVYAAMNRVMPTESYINSAKVLGVDVALGGDDRTVIAPRQGLVAFKPRILRTDDPKTIASEVAVSIKKWQPDAVFIDNTGGWGSGVISHLSDWGHPVTGVQFAGKALDRVYFNKRTEMIHELAYWIKRDGGCLPDMMELKEELVAQTFTHKKDQLLMTPKDQIKEELGRSPDLADAYALTFAYPVFKQSLQEQLMEFGKQLQPADYDPLSGMGNHSAPPSFDDYNPLR